MAVAPKFITFTGVDERTDLYRLDELCVQYPIEIGVLFGGRIGKNRYPSHTRVAELMMCGMSLSAHLCRDYAAAANAGVVPRDLPLHGFDRVQVNRAYGKYNIPGLVAFAETIHKPVIVQNRASTFPVPHQNLQFLQDNSGGRGVLPSYWSRPPETDQFVGYAGGLKPENVADAVKHMPAANFWIDMETGVRTDDWFDLDKVEAVCRAVYG